LTAETGFNPAWLKPLLEPGSVAIAGALQRPGSFGRTTLARTLAGGFAGRIYPVDRNQREILGLKCYSFLADLTRDDELTFRPEPVGLTAR
jgi:acetyltransferase